MREHDKSPFKSRCSDHLDLEGRVLVFALNIDVPRSFVQIELTAIRHEYGGLPGPSSAHSRELPSPLSGTGVCGRSILERGVLLVLEWIV